MVTKKTQLDGVPSGKPTKNYGKIHHFQWVNPLFLWSISIAMLNYQRVSKPTYPQGLNSKAYWTIPPVFSDVFSAVSGYKPLFAM